MHVPKVVAKAKSRHIDLRIPVGRDQGVATLDTRAIDGPASLNTAKRELRLADMAEEQGKEIDRSSSRKRDLPFVPPLWRSSAASFYAVKRRGHSVAWEIESEHVRKEASVRSHGMETCVDRVVGTRRFREELEVDGRTPTAVRQKSSSG